MILGHICSFVVDVLVKQHLSCCVPSINTLAPSGEVMITQSHGPAEMVSGSLAVSSACVCSIKGSSIVSRPRARSFTICFQFPANVSNQKSSNEHDKIHKTAVTVIGNNAVLRQKDIYHFLDDERLLTPCTPNCWFVSKRLVLDERVICAYLHIYPGRCCVA